MSFELEKEYSKITIEEFLDIITENKMYWIAKRLSGNDTGITKGHQAGVYYPRYFFEKNFPEICTTKIKNPDSIIKQVYFPSDDYSCNSIRAIYYNGKIVDGKGKNEFRLTSWGGKSAPIQQHDNTGAIFIFSIFRKDDEIYGLGWVASNETEEEKIEEWIGTELFPGEFKDPDKINFESNLDINKLIKIIPKEWYDVFPSGHDIFSLIEKYIPYDRYKNDIDKLLMERRKHEFSLFKHLELSFVKPIIDNGFTSIDDFIWQANSITNRRKSRTGKSLEHNLESIFKSEGLKFDTQCITENRKKPDFIFPSHKCYHDEIFPVDRLNMLGAKTCCKDRWRQIVSEANKIELKHLFTLQEGTSSQQLKEMEASNVKLVVPQKNIKCFPEEWQNKILTLRKFVDFRKKIDLL